MLDAKYWIYKNGWWLVSVVFFTIMVLLAVVGLGGSPGTILAGATIPAVTLFFFQKHCLNERKSSLRLQADFYKYFTDIYPKLNDMVGTDLSNGLTPEQLNIISAYIDLCSEAYWYYSNGLIAPTVWRSWVEKMRIYYYHAQIRPIWEKELGNQGHYGFDTQIIR